MTSLVVKSTNLVSGNLKENKKNVISFILGRSVFLSNTASELYWRLPSYVH